MLLLLLSQAFNCIIAHSITIYINHDGLQHEVVGFFFNGKSKKKSVKQLSLILHLT